MKSKFNLALGIALLATTALAERAADYVVTVENHKVTAFDMRAKELAVASVRAMPDNRNDMRGFTLSFMREIAAHYHDDHAMFVIITDEYASPLEYKAFVKRFTPDDVTAVVPPTTKRKP